MRTLRLLGPCGQGIATRYDQRVRNFLSVVAIAIIAVFWICMCLERKRLLRPSVKILVLQTWHDAHPYALMGGSVAAALNELGADAQVAKIDPERAVEGLLTAIGAFSPDVVFSFSSILAKLELEDGKSVYDLLNITYVGWHFDHPIYVADNISRGQVNKIAVVSNPAHADFWNFAGWGGETWIAPAAADPPATPPSPFRGRPIPILVVAACKAEPHPVWRDLPFSPVRSLMEAMVARLIDDRDADVLSALFTSAAELSLAPVLTDQLLEILRACLTFVRHHDRMAAIRALVSANLPLTLIGQGWQDHFGARHDVTYLDDQPFDQLPRWYDQAKVCINLNAAHGGSERAFAAMLAGAAVVSDYSPVFSRLGLSNAAIRVHDRGARLNIVEVVSELASSHAGEACARQGHAAATGAHTWRHRLQPLLAHLHWRSAALKPTDGRPG